MTASSEIDLVLATASLGLDESRRERINSLAARDLDWNVVVGLAKRHGTLPLLSEYFGGQSTASIPPAVADQLRAAHRSHASRCLKLSGVLVKIMGSLRSQGIRVLTFKGPTLALLAYGDTALRRFNDLDVWVHPADF